MSSIEEKNAQVKYEFHLLTLMLRAAIEAGNRILQIYKTNFDVEYKADNSPLTQADLQAHQIIEEILKPSEIPILSEEGKDIPYEERKNWKKLWLVDPLDGTKEFVKRNGEFTVNIALIENQEPIMGVIYVPVKQILYFASPTMRSYKLKHVKYEPNWELDLNSRYLSRIPVANNLFTKLIVGSRSHSNQKTALFIKSLRKKLGKLRIVSKGSSLKFCLIAEDTAHLYPRFGPTMEWDTAAGHAIVKHAFGKVMLADDLQNPLIYNKQDLLNPQFIAFSRTATEWEVKSLINNEIEN